MARYDRVDYVILFVRDLDESIGFFRDLIGVDLKLSENGYAELATSNTKLGLYERTRLHELIGKDSSLSGPGAEVLFLVPDVDVEADRLLGLGATILSGPVDRPWGHRTLHVAGPDGIVVELAQEIPRAES